MDETNSTYVPKLTLDPTGAAAAAAPAAPAAPQAAAAQEEKPAFDMSQLSPEEQKAVDDFSKKIDITDTNTVLQYGSASQKNIAEFSSATLNNVRTKDMGEIGDQLSQLVVQLKGFNYGEEEKKGLFGLRKKVANQIASVKAEYAKAETNVDKIVDALESHQIVLLKDVAMLDKMYDMNQAYFKELNMYILAGKKKLDECRSETLPALLKKAQETGLPEDAQAANDYANMINRFEKKIHDLELTRTISIQMAPQIRMIQSSNQLMAEKIQTSIVNTIPLWKSQMVMALSLHHSEQAMKAQREVTDVTNELLTKNAQALHQGSVSIAREAERGIVDLETLKKTNQELIATLDEVRQIQDDGRARRAQAEEELGRIEGELKQKLLDMKG